MMRNASSFGEVVGGSVIWQCTDLLHTEWAGLREKCKLKEERCCHENVGTQAHRSNVSVKDSRHNTNGCCSLTCSVKRKEAHK